MKPSEAMRKGATYRPQVVGNYFDFAPDGDIGSCAWGAIYEGYKGNINHMAYEFDQTTSLEILYEYVDRLSGNVEGVNRIVGCPTPCTAFDYSHGMLPNYTVQYNVGNIISHLNDDHRWTREEIASWLESIGL